MNVSKFYNKKDICAVIITYNPEQVLIDNLSSLIPQVEHIVIIDNGSSKTAFLDKAVTFHIDIIRLIENKGISYALNIGISKCLELGFSLMLTMDQDTVLDSNAVKELLSVMNDTNAKSVGINWDGKAKKNKSVRYLITSGNLVHLDAANSVGGYDERLFIDSVDFDFSLRLSDKGFQMIKCVNAYANHQLGERQEGKEYITHSVERYYYIYRNHFLLIKKHWRRHIFFCLKKQFALLYDLVKIIIMDSQKKEKLNMLKLGFKDSRKMTVE